MEDMKLKMKELEHLEEKLLCAAKEECCDSGDIQKAGLIVDMVKDIASVKKDCAEACYYSQIVEAMEEAKEEEKRYGYNPNRYADGRYAPAGHGNYAAGYVPYYSMDPNEIMGYPGSMGANARGGYPGSSSSGAGSNGSNSTSGNNGGNGGSGSSGYYPSGAGNRSQSGNVFGYHPGERMMQRYGRPWEEYQEARRHYHESHDAEAKREMDERTKEHITDSVETIYDMYEEADPEMKKRIKEKLTALINNMNTVR